MDAYQRERPFWECDRPREECGVIAVFNHPEASALTAQGLQALQHRGEEACGIVSFSDEGHHFHQERHKGLVGDAFKSIPFKERLPGRMSIGHNRYSTSGEKTATRNIQPIYADIATGGFAVAHNGNLSNALSLRDSLVDQGAIFQSTMDTEVIMQLAAQSPRRTLIDRFVDALKSIKGGYALVGLTEDYIIGARDPVGLRPLVLGTLNGGETKILASETCALDMVGAEFVREIEAGEIVVFNRDGSEDRIFPFPRMTARPCAFEYVYFSRPDSVIQGRSVYEVRVEMGRQLALESGIEADVVVPVPDSGVPAAIGFSEQSGTPYQLGIIRSHYVGRTFIAPTQLQRESFVSLKHAPNRPVLRGKRVVLVDDSIVRGTTSKKIVDIVRRAEAKEIHFCSASPRITHTDHYGIDMADTKELFAARFSQAEMRHRLGVDSLHFLSVDGLYRAIGHPSRDETYPQISDHCFTGDYPIENLDEGYKLRNRSGKGDGDQGSFLD
ncbi:MAG: amidophosphoribosyltransferase [Pseudomonadota bacterium]